MDQAKQNMEQDKYDLQNFSRELNDVNMACNLNINTNDFLAFADYLMNTSEKSLRHGYLAVYDARDDQPPIDFKDYSFVNDSLKQYLPYFSVLKVIHLNKRHPA